LSRALLTLWVMGVATACSGAAATTERALWEPPHSVPPTLEAWPRGAGRPGGVESAERLRPVLVALAQDDCEVAAAESAALMAEVEARVTAVFHGERATEAGAEGGLHASAMRDLLDEYVYVEPPLLEIGSHRFRYPRWWVEAYGYCLGRLGRYGEAAEVYALMLQEEVDAEAFWRLALVYAWDGREAEALVVLEAWPEALEAPAALPAVRERLRRGERVPARLPQLEAGW
jgi:hypothetical protein